MLSKAFSGKQQGPTVEVIDPVRYVSNRSSGKMGYAIAEALRDKGAIVTLISGPTHLSLPEGINVVKLRVQMFQAVTERFAKQDIVIKSAAVSDYTPMDILEHKLKNKKEDYLFNLSVQRIF